MTTFSFEIDSSETSKLKAVLKAFGVKKLKVENPDETKLSKSEFEKKLKKAKAGKGTKLTTKKEVSDFFSSL